MAVYDISSTNRPVSITGELNMKRVGAYFKASHKTNTIRVQRYPEYGSFFLSNGFLVVWVPQSPDLLPFTFFPIEWERATFLKGEDTASEGGPDMAAMWETWTSQEGEEEWERLTLTHFLWEDAGARNKPGQFARKFAAYNEQEEKYKVYLNKKLCDMLTPDIEELEGFLFETAGHEKPVRVAAKNGWVAVIMPMYMKGKG